MSAQIPVQVPEQQHGFNLLSQFMSDFSLDSFINNFHFIRPWWLLAFVALFIVLYLLKKIRYYQSPWQHFLPEHLANALLENSQNQASQTTKTNSSHGTYWIKPTLIGFCVIFALAGPAWQKLPQPVYQLERGAVLIMDMSYSMFSTDVKPNRLTRARFKAIDLLNHINEGDMGLLAYAGDAFVISPLTQDVKNIELLLPSLSPDIMPVPGANALAALTLADKTLKNAGHVSGDIYWFTDDIDLDEMSDVLAWANDNSHKVNILGVGSSNGAPIKLSNGKLLKDNKGAIVIPKLPEDRLAAIARRGRGVYQTMRNDDSDIKALTAHLSNELYDNNNEVSDLSKEGQDKQAMQGDQYQEQGPWLLIILLPLLLSYFRRGSSILAIGWLMPICLLVGLSSVSPNSYAASQSPIETPDSAAVNGGNTANQFWQDLWQTADQQAQQHYQAENYQQAAEQFKDSQWQGSAHYKAGNYEKALQSFKQSDSAQSLYNQGNSLAQLNKIDEAIDAYQQALAKDPNLTNAKENLAALEAAKQQQEQKQSQDGDGEKQENKDKQENQTGDSQSQDQNQQGDEQQSDNQQNSDESSSQNQQQNQEQSDEEKDAAEQAQQAKDKEAEQSEEQTAMSEEANESDEEPQGNEATLAQQAIDKETEQKHQQILNKVTDDPYLLLRNKMRLEYQKRRNEGTGQGVTKKW